MQLTQQETNKIKERDEQHTQELREWRGDLAKRKQVCESPIHVSEVTCQLMNRNWRMNFNVSARTRTSSTQPTDHCLSSCETQCHYRMPQWRGPNPPVGQSPSLISSSWRKYLTGAIPTNLWMMWFLESLLSDWKTVLKQLKMATLLEHIIIIILLKTFKSAPLSFLIMNHNDTINCVFPIYINICEGIIIN